MFDLKLLNLSLTILVGVPQILINLLNQLINEAEVMPGDNSKEVNRLAAHVNTKIKHLLTSNLLEYMSLTNKGPAKSKPVSWNGNSAHTQYSGNATVGGGRNTFPWTVLHVTHGLMIFWMACRPLMIQYFNRNSANVDCVAKLIM